MVEGVIRGDERSAAASVARLQELTDELAGVLSTYDPIPVVGQIAYLSTLSLTPEGDPYETFGTAARVQYLVGIALSASERPSAVPQPSEVQTVIDLTSDIFYIENAFLLSDSAGASPDHVRDARRGLLLEALLDRFQGYTVHLRTILSEVFEPIREACTSQLGWCPADLSVVTTAVHDEMQRRGARHDEAMKDLRARLQRPGADPSAYLASQASFGSSVFIHSAQAIAAASGLSLGVVEPLLQALSMSWGEQPDFRRPSESNRARRHGAIALGEGQYFIQSPAALLNEVYGWFEEVLRERGLESLERTFRRSRDRATESLTKTRLSGIFGHDRVMGPLWYTIDGTEYEVDAIVLLPLDALIVECKAHTLTDAGRRGAPARLEKKFGELLTASAIQSDRCAKYLSDGDGTFRDSRGQEIKVRVAPQAALRRMTVSFERIDPLASQAAVASSGEAAPCWIASLADLLMVSDVLSNPAEFFAYATVRNEHVTNPRLYSVSEPDVLGMFIVDRCKSLQSGLTLADGGEVFVGPWAQALNTHYIRMELGLESTLPNLKLPAAVLNALQIALDRNQSGWCNLATVVTQEDADTWRRFRSIDRKMRRAAQRGIPVERRFDGTSGPLTVVCYFGMDPPSDAEGQDWDDDRALLTVNYAGFGARTAAGTS
jgi:hypothetical protein